MYAIDDDIPIPPPKLGTPPKYPFMKMGIGDSFFVPNGDQSKVNCAARMCSYRHPGLKFRAQTVIEDGVKGVRVWRVS